MDNGDGPIVNSRLLVPELAGGVGGGSDDGT
jgi:hypothetical protein